MQAQYITSEPGSLTNGLWRAGVAAPTAGPKAWRQTIDVGGQRVIWGDELRRRRIVRIARLSQSPRPTIRWRIDSKWPLLEVIALLEVETGLF
jgi:hypothetical protein